jgi:hypothetical protein
MNKYILLNKKIEGNKVGFLILLFNFYENFYFNNFGEICGKVGTLCSKNNWVKTLCEEHMKEFKYKLTRE